MPIDRTDRQTKFLQARDNEFPCCHACAILTCGNISVAENKINKKEHQ